MDTKGLGCRWGRPLPLAAVVGDLGRLRAAMDRAAELGAGLRRVAASTARVGAVLRAFGGGPR